LHKSRWCLTPFRKVPGASGR